MLVSQFLLVSPLSSLFLEEHLFLFVKFDFPFLCDPFQDIIAIAPENIISRDSFFVLRFKQYIYLPVVVSSSLPDSPRLGA